MKDVDGMPLTRPGLSHIKQVHFYSKCRKLLSTEAHNITCPDPSREVVDRCKKDMKQEIAIKKALMYPNDEDYASQHYSDDNFMGRNNNSKLSCRKGCI